MTSGVSPAAARMAKARAAGYAVLARLVDEGVGADTAQLASLSPRLAPIVAASSLDVIAADQCHVFDVSAPPFEGFITDPQGQIGNEAGMRVRDRLHEVGARLAHGDDPEHLAVQLRVMAQLASAERDCSSAPLRSAAMLDHLLRWVIPYEAAVIRTGRAYPSALVAEIVGLAAHHRAGVRSDVGGRAAPTAQRTAELDLDAPDTGLRAIATFLARPAQSGLVLTRDDITHLGRGARIPRGFGSREHMLSSLLRTAAELGQLVPVVAALESAALAQLRHLTARARTLGSAAGALARWFPRLGTTRTLLARVRAEAGRSSEGAQ